MGNRLRILLLILLISLFLFIFLFIFHIDLSTKINIFDLIDISKSISPFCVRKDKSYDAQDKNKSCCFGLTPIPLPPNPENGNSYEILCAPSKIDGHEVIY